MSANQAFTKIQPLEYAQLSKIKEEMDSDCVGPGSYTILRCRGIAVLRAVV